jgi:hypothetical protein
MTQNHFKQKVDAKQDIGKAKDEEQQQEGFQILEENER